MSLVQRLKNLTLNESMNIEKILFSFYTVLLSLWFWCNHKIVFINIYKNYGPPTDPTPKKTS